MKTSPEEKQKLARSHGQDVFLQLDSVCAIPPVRHFCQHSLNILLLTQLAERQNHCAEFDI